MSALALLLRLLYAALTAVAAAFALAPWTREAFVRYGKTRPPQTRHPAPAAALRWFASRTVPKNWFSHFYYVGAGLGALLLSDVGRWPWIGPGSGTHSAPWGLVPRLAALLGDQREAFASTPSAHAILALAMYNAHVLVRLKESVFDQPATDARMHIGQYAVGLLFYTATPLALVVDAYDSPRPRPLLAWMAPAGMAVFAYASLHQWRCHRILFGLRRRSLSAPRQTGLYAIPSGDLFTHVSSPHFFCEILLYASIWIATGCQSTSVLWVVLWTAVNLGITARETHRWYRETFGDAYPRSRRALIPFV
ncbi:hypothetical protein IWQ57_004811, partial [Coemansia nantahalensis]